MEEQRNALARQLETGGGMLARVGIGADLAEVRAELRPGGSSHEATASQARQLAPRIEAAKTKADFLAQECTRVAWATI